MRIFTIEFQSASVPAGRWIFRMPDMQAEPWDTWEVEHLEDAWKKLCSNGSGVAAMRVLVGLQRLAETRPGFIEQLHDEKLVKADSGYLSLFKEQPGEKTLNHLAAELVFFQGLWLYLKENGQDDFKRARLFSAWQWYHLSRVLFSQAVSELDIRTERLMRINMAEAYRNLFQLLAEPGYMAALQWLARLAIPEWFTSAESTLQEKAMLSLYTQGNEDFEKSLLKAAYGRPCGAASMSANRINWRGLHLLPVFQEAHNAREVRQFIHTWLLPRYDFRSALLLAALLASGKHKEDSSEGAAKEKASSRGRLSKKAAWLFMQPGVMLGIFILWLVAVIGCGSRLAVQPVFQQQGEWGLFGTSLGELVLLALPFFILWILVGENLIGYLTLPRLVAGVMVGYLALVMQGSPDSLREVFWRETIINHRLVWIEAVRVGILWLAVLVMGYLYLKYDILPMLQDARLAGRRAGFMLWVAMLTSSLLGLGAVAFTTRMLESGRQALVFFIGPLGKVDLLQYLVFVPLAFFTGLATQLLFEQKPLTAPVWSPEQPN